MMDDAEYCFRQTVSERKRTGRGDFCKKRKGGRFVRLPSDNLTEKQRKGLNGKIMAYNMSLPVKWSEFKNWPIEHQRSYFKRIDEKFRATNAQIGEMFGVSASAIIQRRKKCGARGIQGQHKNTDLAGWMAFCKGEVIDSDISSPEESIKIETPKNDTDLANITLLLKALSGSGAKITIELTI